MWRKLILSSLIFCALSWALASQVPSSTLPSSDPATAQLQMVVQQLRGLRTRIQGYDETWTTLSPALETLLRDSQTDSESLTKLTAQLSLSAQDSQAVSTLSTRLSQRFSELSISYSTAKLVNRIAIPAGAVAVGALILSIVTKGFTSW